MTIFTQIRPIGPKRFPQKYRYLAFLCKWSHWNTKHIGREINIWNLGSRNFNRQHFRNFYYLREKSDSSVPRSSHRQYANSAAVSKNAFFAQVVEISEVLPIKISRPQIPNVYLSANVFVAQWDHLRTI